MFLLNKLTGNSPQQVDDDVPVEAEITDVILEEKKLPLRGFTLAYLSNFRATYAEQLEGMTVMDVFTSIIKPQLQATGKVSWCEILAQQGLSTQSEEDQQEANCFVCYAHEYLFNDVVDALTSSLGGENGSVSVAAEQDCVLWMDIFCCDILDSNEVRDAGWWASIYGNTIAAMSTMLLVMMPWENPYTLSRARCVYELFASEIKKCKLEVAMSSSENQRFLTGVSTGNSQGITDFLKLLAGFRSQLTETDPHLSPEDAKGLTEAIVDNTLEEIDLTVHNMLEKWLISVMRKQIDSCGRAGQVEAAAQWMNALGGLFRRKAKFDLAEPLLLSCLEIRKRNLGDAHADTLTSMNNLAGLYKAQGKNAQAEGLYVSCLQGRRTTLGDDHPNTLGTMNNLAGVYKNMGQFELAEPFYVSCLDSTRRVLGDDHPDTLTSMNNLALLYRGMNQLAHAEPLYVMCLEGRVTTLGVEHPDTLGTMNNLALLYDDKGDFAAAEPLYVKCMDVRNGVLGDRHPDTLQSIDNLGSLYRRLDRLEDAEVSIVWICVIVRFMARKSLVLTLALALALALHPLSSTLAAPAQLPRRSHSRVWREAPTHADLAVQLGPLVRGAWTRGGS